jgi:hypothetical protein
MFDRSLFLTFLSIDPYFFSHPPAHPPPSLSFLSTHTGYEFTAFTWPKLLLAVRCGDEFNARALIENRSFDPNDADELARCIDAAASRGDERICRALIRAGADPSQHYPDAPRTSWAPLCVAAEYGQTHLVKALLDLGADVNGTFSSWVLGVIILFYFIL